MEEIVVAGVKIPQTDWEQTPESVQEIVRQLATRLSNLEEQLGLNSKTSSKPPSSDPPSQPKDPRPKRKRQRGGQPGHQGFGRKLYDTSECREVFKHKPEYCRSCGHTLQGEDPHPYRHQIVEIPPVKPEVDEHQLHALECECCGTITRAELPKEVNRKGYGERVRAIVGLLSGAYRLSHQQVQELLSTLWNLPMSTGSINRIRQEVSEAVSESVTAAIAYVQQSEQAHIDETSWRQHNGDGENSERKQAWLWVATTGTVSVYQVRLDRRQDSAKRLLSETYTGIVISDRYSGYSWLPVEQRQICWAHLQRDLARIAERTGAAGELGRALLRLTRRFWHWWQRVRDGTLSWPLFKQAVAHLRRRFRARLQEAVAVGAAPQEKTPWARTVRTCAKLLKVEPALWTFVRCPGVEPTNNRAERALRPAVIWRRVSLGSQSLAGSQFVSRMLTVVMTLRAQGRSVLDFLVQALRSESPSLIPSA
jgi:hypothetical protein